MYKRQYSIWTWTRRTSAAPPSLFHVPNGFAYYVGQYIRPMSREQERETVFSPLCKAKLGHSRPVVVKGCKRSFVTIT